MSVTNTPNNITQAANTLRSLEPGFLPLEIFHAVAGLTVTPVIELVPFKADSASDPQVLLTRRDADDTHWPSLLHVPGTVIRASDEPDDDLPTAFNRLFSQELPEITVVGDPEFVQIKFHQVRRGMELALVHYVLVEGSTDDKEYYSVNDLPEDIVDHQVGFIHAATERFSRTNG